MTVEDLIHQKRMRAGLQTGIDGKAALHLILADEQASLRHACQTSPLGGNTKYFGRTSRTGGSENTAVPSVSPISKKIDLMVVIGPRMGLPRGLYDSTDLHATILMIPICDLRNRPRGLDGAGTNELHLKQAAAAGLPARQRGNLGTTKV
ncbi:MAG TPA: hypothetical protein VGO42_12590 [Reyranella sp.]|nr:hypothetical protein [Reyranella sp.]